MLKNTSVTAIQGGVDAIYSLSRDEKIREYARQRELAEIDYNLDVANAEARGRVKGKAEGKAEGMEIGMLNTLIELVKDGILTLADGAKRANMSVEDFKKKLD